MRVLTVARPGYANDKDPCANTESSNTTGRTVEGRLDP
jgi:hypothetical protein